MSLKTFALDSSSRQLRPISTVKSAWRAINVHCLARGVQRCIPRLLEFQLVPDEGLEGVRPLAGNRSRQRRSSGRQELRQHPNNYRTLERRSLNSSRSVASVDRVPPP